MIIWDQMGNSHENVVFGKHDHYTVEQNMSKGWKYAVSREGFSSGVHFWHIKYEMSSFPEVPNIAIGICTLPLNRGLHSILTV